MGVRSSFVYNKKILRCASFEGAAKVVHVLCESLAAATQDNALVISTAAGSAASASCLLAPVRTQTKHKQ